MYQLTKVKRIVSSIRLKNRYLKLLNIVNARELYIFIGGSFKLNNNDKNTPITISNESPEKFYKCLPKYNELVFIEIKQDGKPVVHNIRFDYDTTYYFGII